MDLLTSDGEHSLSSLESLMLKILYQDGFPATGESGKRNISIQKSLLTLCSAIALLPF